MAELAAAAHGQTMKTLAVTFLASLTLLALWAHLDARGAATFFAVVVSLRWVFLAAAVAAALVTPLVVQEQRRLARAEDRARTLRAHERASGHRAA